MSLHWYACISINTYCHKIYHILLETVWWALSNASLIVWIHPAIHEILANKDFIVTDDLISQLFVVTFVHPTYVQIAFTWGFLAQLSLWKSVHWLWRYKLNEVCGSCSYFLLYFLHSFYKLCYFFYFFFSSYIHPIPQFSTIFHHKWRYLSCWIYFVVNYKFCQY